MPDTAILHATPRARRTEIDGIVLDATVRELHEYTAHVTEHPIETGSSVADHVYTEPLRLLLQGEITDSPVQPGAETIGVTERRVEAFDRLREIHAERRVVTVVTGLRVYPDMVMVLLSVPRDRTTGRRLQFSAEFVQIERVQTERVPLPPEKIAPAQRERAQSGRDIGRQQVREATAEQEEAGSRALGEWQSGSLLAGLGDLF